MIKRIALGVSQLLSWLYQRQHKAMHWALARESSAPPCSTRFGSFCNTKPPVKLLLQFCCHFHPCPPQPNTPTVPWQWHEATHLMLWCHLMAEGASREGKGSSDLSDISWWGRSSSQHTITPRKKRTIPLYKSTRCWRYCTIYYKAC